MKASKLLKTAEVFHESGKLAQVADHAAAAGFRYFSLDGKVFELDPGRVAGSSLGVHRIRNVELVD